MVHGLILGNFAKKRFMIQRIQTIYYLIGLLILTTGICSPVLYRNDVPNHLDFFWLKYGVYAYVFGIVGLFVTILKFKPLKRQLFLGRVFLFTSLIICAFNAYTVFSVTGILENVHISWSFYFLFLSPIAIYLGNRGVKKDIQLLNSLNRLR